MALTQVRARIGTEWVTLTYNDATGRYEGTLTPPGTSIHQPGGYYSVEVEATNDSGDTASISGAQLASLRLVVQETTAPVVTLVSPAQGYVTTPAPVVVFSAVDEAGGSGVDPDSGAAYVDGVSVPCTVAEADGGYTVTVACSGLSDGPHTVTVSISDYDGNVGTASAAYTVDTVPPVLYLTEPYMRHVTDEESVTVAGAASDATSGVGSVTVDGTPAAASGSPPSSGGALMRFSATVELDVGENTIPVVVTDVAGNQTAGSVYMIRLVTDRKQSDIDTIKALWDKPVDTWTAAEQTAWDKAVKRGGWDSDTLNRVGVTVGFLAGELRKRGFSAPVVPKTDWAKEGAPTIPQMETYLQNVETVRTAQGLPVTAIPSAMRKSSIDDWNRIEKALVETDQYFPLHSYWTAGELSAGEF